MIGNMVDLRNKNDKELNDWLEASYGYAKDYRYNEEIIWKILQQYYDGKEYVKVDLKTGNVTSYTPRNSDVGTDRRVDRYINLYRKFERAVKSLVLAIDPQWDAIYTNPTKKSYDAGLVASHFLRWLWYKPDDTSLDGKNMRTKLKDLVALGYRRGKAHFEVSTIVYKGNKIPNIQVVDPFDLYISPNSDYRMKAYNMTVEQLKREYPEKAKDIAPDNEWVPSKRKRTWLNWMQEENITAFDSHQNVILYDVFVKEPADNEWGCQIRKIKWHQKSNIILENEVMDGMHDFPFVDYTPEADNKKLYPYPITVDYVDPIKTYNRMYNHIEEWVKVMAKGRWYVEAGTKMTPMANFNGQVIEYAKGRVPPVQQQVSPLSEASSKMLEVSKEIIQDLSGATAEAMGQQSYSNMPAKSVLALQAAAENNTSEPLDNLKTALEALGRKVLEHVELNLETPLKFYKKDKQDEDQEEFMVRGAKSPLAKEGRVYKTNEKIYDLEESSGEPLAEGMEPLPKDLEKPIREREIPMVKDVVDIETPDQVRVEITTGGIYSKLAREQRAMELAQAGLIDQQTLLEELAFSNVQEILLRSKKEKEEEIEREGQKTPQEMMEGKAPMLNIQPPPTDAMAAAGMMAE